MTPSDISSRSLGEKYALCRAASSTTHRSSLDSSPRSTARSPGLATYKIIGDDCEVVTIDAFVRRQGVGSALIRAITEVARQHGCKRLWLITTNDNADALRFYLRIGMRLVAVHLDALDRSRELKPSIPLVGRDGVPIRDEWELEIQLGSDALPSGGNRDRR